MQKKGIDYDKSIFFLTTPIMMCFKEQYFWATFWKLITQSINIILPFFIKGFVKLIKSSNPFDYFYGFRTCFLVLILSICSGIFAEQSSKNVAFIRATSGQMVRILFAEKILCINESFKEINDNSFVTKILLFEISPVLRFLGAIPNLIVSPISIIFSLVMLYISLNVGVYSLVVMIIFVIVVVMINILHRKIIHRKVKYSSYGSKRTDKLNELIKFIKHVKLNNLQDLLMRNLWRSRTNELKELEHLHNLEILLDLVFEVTPILTALFLIILNYS